VSLYQPQVVAKLIILPCPLNYRRAHYHAINEGGAPKVNCQTLPAHVLAKRRASASPRHWRPA
jgi:hypothetical protein